MKGKGQNKQKSESYVGCPRFSPIDDRSISPQDVGARSPTNDRTLAVRSSLRSTSESVSQQHDGSIGADEAGPSTRLCALPLLFLFYINELAKLLPDGNVSALFADDVSILATAREIPKATERAQEAVDLVDAWSHEWKLSLNADKSESALFSSWTNEARMQITIGGEPIKMAKDGAPRLLGVKVEACGRKPVRCLQVPDSLPQGPVLPDRDLRTYDLMGLHEGFRVCFDRFSAQQI